MIRKRDGRFVVEVYDPTTRKKVSVSAKKLGLPVPSTMREAKALERAALAQMEKVRPGQETVEHFAARWMTDFTEGRSESTILHNKERVKKIAKDFHGRTMNSITRQEAEAWALANRSRVREVRAMWNDAIRVGVASDNPFKGIGYARKGRRDIQVLSPGEVERLAELAVEIHGEGFGEEFAALIKWAAYTGMRPGEIMAARWSNLKGDIYHVTEQVNTKLGRTTEPKHGSAGSIFVPTPALEAVQAIPRHDDDLIFHTKTGKRFSATTLREAWVPVRAAFGRPDLDLYELRHYAASYMLNVLHIEPWVIAKQLRHSDDGKLVVMLYGHPDKDVALGRIRTAFVTGKENGAKSSGAQYGADPDDLQA
jgi:integrase